MDAIKILLNEMCSLWITIQERSRSMNFIILMQTETIRSLLQHLYFLDYAKQAPFHFYPHSHGLILIKDFYYGVSMI